MIFKMQTWITFPNATFLKLIGIQCNSANVYDVGFVLDVSGSIGRSGWEIEKTFTKKLARVIDISPSGGRAGVVLFNSYAYMRIKFNTHNTYTAFAGGVDRLPFTGGGTSITWGLKIALSQLFQASAGMRTNSYKEVVLITDGRDWGSTDYDSIARQYRSRGIKIIIIGVGSVDQRNLRKLVANSKDFYIANNFQQLDSFAENVGQTICNGMYKIFCNWL